MGPFRRLGFIVAQVLGANKSLPLNYPAAVPSASCVTPPPFSKNLHNFPQTCSSDKILARTCLARPPPPNSVAPPLEPLHRGGPHFQKRGHLGRLRQGWDTQRGQAQCGAPVRAFAALLNTPQHPAPPLSSHTDALGEGG